MSDIPDYLKPPPAGKLEFDDYVNECAYELKYEFLESRGITGHEFIEDENWEDFKKECYTRYLDTPEHDDMREGCRGHEGDR